MGEIEVRTARIQDAGELLKIYAPYVENTAITFEYEVPSLEEFRGRMERTLEKYPYLVADLEGEILGYCYTGTFKERAAYGWSVETTIYVKGGCKGMGIGRRLYTVLEDISRRQNIRNLNACIGYPEEEDEHLTRDSMYFHERMGYSMVGRFHKCGYKFGRWYDMIWMEKLIGEHGGTPRAVIPFSELYYSGSYKS